MSNAVKRNPYALVHDEVLTPVQLLQRKLEFSVWERNNPVVHLPICKNDAHRQVMINGMCCVAHIRQCIEGHLCDLAACRAGIFDEPVGFSNWLDQAYIRLNELLAGQDKLEYWTDFLKENRDQLYGWIMAHGDHCDQNRKPGFSLYSFLLACKKHDFVPPFTEVAISFYATETDVANCWNNL